MKPNTNGYRGYRFPPEIISRSVWLYHRFALSFRDVEELLAKRGIIVTYETIRQSTRENNRHPNTLTRSNLEDHMGTMRICCYRTLNSSLFFISY